MLPLKTVRSNVTFVGPTPDVGDLPSWRDGDTVYSVWEPSSEERALIASGANVELGLRTVSVPPISLNVYVEKGDLDADVSSVWGGNDRLESQGQRPEGGSGPPRIAVVGPGPVEGGGLVDGATDGGGGEPGLVGGQPGDAPGDLSGAEVALADLVRITDGDGAGLAGEVVGLQVSYFGHVHVTVRTEDHRTIATLQSKIEKL